MDEKPKSIWKKSFAGRSALKIWAMVVGLAIALGFFLIALANTETPVGESFGQAALIIGGCVAVCALVIYIVWPLLRWLFWKHWRRTLFASFCFATLIALFYAEENWRGKRAWENYKHEWEAKGEKFDFKDFIPPPVSDEQNFAMADVVASSYDWILSRAGEKIPYEKRDTNAINHLDFGLANNSLEQATKGSDWMAGSRADMKAKLELFTREAIVHETNLFDPSIPTLSDAKNLLRVLDKYSATIQELRIAGQRPQSRFPLNYNTDCPAASDCPPRVTMQNFSGSGSLARPMACTAWNALPIVCLSCTESA